MKRREFITLLGGAFAWPLAAWAQSERMRRVGVLMPFAESDSDAQANVTAFRQALQMLGWADSHNVRIDYRWGGGEAERISAYASELVRLKPDVILASSPLVLQPLLQETRSIPVVFTQITDPVGSGLRAAPPTSPSGRRSLQPPLPVREDRESKVCPYMLASSPASMVNQRSPDLGIPNRSNPKSIQAKLIPL
jgi:hypothetical protein